MKVFVLTVLATLLLATSPGSRYTLKERKDNVAVYYRWRTPFRLFKLPEKRLELFIANENEYRVSVSFSMDFYKNAFLEFSTDTLTYCIPPNYEIYGNFRQLEFEPTDSLEYYLEQGLITWEITSWNIYKSDTCQLKDNWK